MQSLGSGEAARDGPSTGGTREGEQRKALFGLSVPQPCLVLLRGDVLSSLSQLGVNLFH